MNWSEDLTRRTLLRAGAAAAAFGAHSAGAQARPSLIIGVQDNPPQLDPLRLTTNVTFRIAANIYDFLIRTEYGRQKQERRVPGLAESWRQREPRVWEIALRDGVLFHDGGRMTADDVAFSFGPQRMLTDGLPGAGVSRQFFSGFEKVEALDQKTVRFTTKAEDPLFEHRLAGWGSQIISRAAFEKTNDWDRWALAPVGTGPYKVVEVKTGEYIRLASHDAYWGGTPPFASITFRIMPEAASRANALLAGDVHLITEVSPDQIPQIEGRPTLEVVGGGINNLRVLNFGTFDGPLKDVRIRRALSLAIDRELIAKEFFAGRVGVPQGYQFAAYGDMFIADFPKPAYDLEAAKRLLREANYSGQPIEYRTTNAYYTAELATAQILQQMWAAAGIRVELKVVENWSQVFAQPINAIFNGSINMVYPDMIGALYVLYGPNGFIRFQAKSWKSDEFDEIGRSMQTLTDRGRRRALHKRALEIFAVDDPPGLPLHETGMFYGKRRDVAWAPGPLPYMDFGPFNPAARGS